MYLLPVEDDNSMGIVMYCVCTVATDGRILQPRLSLQVSVYS